MILDRLDNAGIYAPLSPGIAAALRFLSSTDLTKIPDGRRELDGDKLYAVVMHYQPRPLDKIVWESHRKYFDVQYVVSGVERMGYTCLSPDLKVTQAYDAKTDAALYDARGDLFVVPAGHFAIFAPQDVHAPGLAADTAAPVQVMKIVVKVQVEQG